MSIIAKSSLYTKKGDGGKTSIREGIKLDKDDQRINAIGTIDEFNSGLGILIALLDKKNDDLEVVLIDIQTQLFAIGAYIALPDPESVLCPTDDGDIETIERMIDCWDQQCPPLKNFILPGGDIAAAQSHSCRSLARRTEREIIKLTRIITIDPVVLKYFNRLSDALFALARLLNLRANHKETIWKQNEEGN